MDETIETNGNVPAATAPPGWFTALTWLSVAWEVFGCYNYLHQVTVNPASLPLDQRGFYDAAPTWMIAAFAVAVWVGLAGAVMMAAKRKSAVTLLLMSLIAVIVQFSALEIDPKLRVLTTSGILTVPIIIILLCYGIFQLSMVGRRRGWLR